MERIWVGRFNLRFPSLSLKSRQIWLEAVEDWWTTTRTYTCKCIYIAKTGNNPWNPVWFQSFFPKLKKKGSDRNTTISRTYLTASGVLWSVIKTDWLVGMLGWIPSFWTIWQRRWALDGDSCRQILGLKWKPSFLTGLLRHPRVTDFSRFFSYKLFFERSIFRYSRSQLKC